jgi:hypothetical protein
MLEYLKGHTSPESAYLVEDYPYGFTLRCQIRYWLEYRKGHGFRLVSQTTNPKRAGHPWNKPKASTYCSGPSFLTRNDENGYISWSGFDFRDLTANKGTELIVNHGDKLPPEFMPELQHFVAVKREYEKLTSEGMDYRQAVLIAEKRVMPAKAIKAVILERLASHFAGNDNLAPHLTSLTTIVESGTIGKLEDFLKSFNLAYTSFRDDAVKDPTCALCDAGETHEH